VNVERAGGDPAGKASPYESDARLAVGLRQRSSDALAEVYRRHGGAVIGRARDRCGDPAAAEDIAQEVFLALWRDPTRFDPSRGSLRTYLLALTNHRSIDVYRSEQSRRRRQERCSSRTDTRPNPEDTVVATDEAARVRMSLDDLPSDERLAIDLAYFGYHSYREVARLLGEPEGTIKSRIRAGLHRLRSVPEPHRRVDQRFEAAPDVMRDVATVDAKAS